MANKSTKRAKRTDRAGTALDRPFDPPIVQEAARIAQKYRIILEQDEDCGYIGSSLEMPNVYGDGRTADRCVNNLREALTVAVAYLLESGQAPPAPADEQVRDKQINVRLTDTEQRRLREAAKARGYTDISDYVRSTTLAARSG